ncbi:MAG: FAD:protein FMN transferase [Planctomycetota bacterium]|jgi:thiamine biosynthesis lipoprotein
MNRRRFLALGAGAFAFAALPLATRRPRLVRRSLPVMGTIAEIAVAGDHADIDAAFAELAFVDRTMSRFRADSDVGRLNRAGRAVTIGAPTAFVLERALSWAEASDGGFDPCLGRATELWDLRVPPDAIRLRRLAGRRLYRSLDLDKARAIVRDPDVAVDLGGIAKGYAVDRAADALRARGVRDALVNVGGDLVALGRSADGDPWRIGIADPDAPDRWQRTIELEDAAVATSGDYQRFFTHGGRRYHHLLDPATAAPCETATRSVTVAADNCLTADAAATAVYANPELRLPYRARIV